MTDPDLPTLRQALAVWARIGCLSFGGPAAQIALMHRMLVEERGWIGDRRFLHALNYCMLLPGPEAQQLATYIGWLLHRTWGGIAAGLLFILPGAVVMLGLSIVYALYGQTPLVAGLFFGVKAAVLAIIVDAVRRLSARAVKGRVMIGLAIAAFLAIALFDAPFPLIVLAAGLFGWLAARRGVALDGGSHGRGGDKIGAIDRLLERETPAHVRPSARKAAGVIALWLPLWFAPALVLLLTLGDANFWTRLAGFFSTMGLVTFGGAYAVLGYVAQAAVEGEGWLTTGQMADGLGLAETTLGPLILVLQFVGFLAAFKGEGSLLAGTLGALLVLWTVFIPSFFWIFLGGPYVEALRHNRALAGALAAITAAVVGVIANLALWFALHFLFARTLPGPLGIDLPDLATLDWRAGVLAAACAVAILRFKAGVVPVLLASAAIGLALSAIPA